MERINGAGEHDKRWRKLRFICKVTIELTETTLQNLSHANFIGKTFLPS